MRCKKTRPTVRGAISLFILLLVLVSGGCASPPPPVTVVCEPPDEKLLVPLELSPAMTVGEMEDELVKFVRETLPLDNARKDELRKQIEKQKK